MRNATSHYWKWLRRCVAIATIRRVWILTFELFHVQRMVMEQNAQLLRTKNEKLEKLCRALQAERNQLRKQDKPVRPSMIIFFV